MTNNIKIKVCGLRDVDNIKDVTELPIDYIGFIFYDKSPRYVHEPIDIAIPRNIKKTGVFVNASLEFIQQKAKEHSLQAIQLHGQEDPAFCATLQATGLELIKAFGIDAHFNWTTLEAYLPHVTYFLFDTKSPQHGGTGQTFSWELLQQYPYSKPYFLSGGIAANNIREASKLEDSRLYALDLNSKFESTPAIKDIKLLNKALTTIL